MPFKVGDLAVIGHGWHKSWGAWVLNAANEKELLENGGFFHVEEDVFFGGSEFEGYLVEIVKFYDGSTTSGYVYIPVLNAFTNCAFEVWLTKLEDL